MRSPAQIAASRANGARSKGPVTAQGKRNSSRNSTRHGFSAPDPSLDHNPPAAFIELRNGFMASLQPRNDDETQLVHTMAVAHWRQLQVVKEQTVSLNKAMDSHLSNSPDPAVRAVLAFKTASDFHALERYEAAFDRQSARLLHRLLYLQSRPAKNFLTEQTQQATESKATAIEAILPNPAPPTTTIQEDSVEVSRVPRFTSKARSKKNSRRTNPASDSI